MQLLPVLPLEIGIADQRRLQQPHQEDARPGEGVEDMDALVAQAPPELQAHHVIGAREDEVHDLDRGVDDAEPVRVLLHRGREELLVELHQHALARGRVVEAARPQPHALVEAFEVAGLVLQPELPEVAPQRVERAGHRVAAGEVVALEQRLEHRARQDVLRHHVDGAPGVIDWLIDTLSSAWNASNHSRRALVAGIASRPPMRVTRREKMSATSFAQLSQYFRSPHFSTILA